jgi:hypothetical protein
MMLRILPALAAALAACTPSPQDAAMRSPNPIGTNVVSGEQAAQGPILEPVSAAENPGPAPSMDSPDEARGRRTLSTAFVRVGPDGHLTIALRDGRELVLRDMVMRPKDYCGHLLSGGRHCGGYADVVMARPGGAPDSAAPNPDGAKGRPIGKR